MNIWAIIISTLVFTGITVGGGWFVWVKIIHTKKRQVWKAKVYQLGGAVKTPMLDKNGNKVTPIELVDIKPYTVDMIEKVVRGPGQVIFRLQKLDIPVKEVTAEVVEYWGKKDKIVDVLVEGESATLLRKGYNKDAHVVFEPMPYDRMNMCASNIIMRKDRLVRKDAHILAKVLPYFAIVFGVMGMVFMGFVWGNVMTETQKMNLEAQKEITLITQDGLNNVAAALGQLDVGIKKAKQAAGQVVEEPTPPPPPPPVE